MATQTLSRLTWEEYLALERAAEFKSEFVDGQMFAMAGVACGDAGASGDADLLVNPVVIVEVRSPSTADYDRGKKFELYREIPSLMDYVLTHVEAPWIEHFSRQSDSTWLFREYRGLESVVVIDSLECTIPLARVYREV